MFGTSSTIFYRAISVLRHLCQLQMPGFGEVFAQKGVGERPQQGITGSHKATAADIRPMLASFSVRIGASIFPLVLEKHHTELSFAAESYGHRSVWCAPAGAAVLAGIMNGNIAASQVGCVLNKAQSRQLGKGFPCGFRIQVRKRRPCGEITLIPEDVWRQDWLRNESACVHHQDTVTVRTQ